MTTKIKNHREGGSDWDSFTSGLESLQVIIHSNYLERTNLGRPF
jgi:hypothetical protein